MAEFRLTEDHLKLLENAEIGWQDAETGAPAIDPKRPYGSGVAFDVAEILRWEPIDWEDEESVDAAWDRALEIHGETATALQIVLQTRAFIPGVYSKVGYLNWEWISD